MNHPFSTDLRKTQFTLNSILDAIANDFIIVNNENKIRYINLKAKTNLFSDITEIGDAFNNSIDRFCSLHNVQNCPELLELITRASTPNSFITEKIKINLKKSILKTYEVLTSPIYDQELGHLGRIWQFTDITFSENIDNLKSEFISVASHQLRTPLTSIRGYIDMVLDGDYGEVKEELKEPLGYVEKASKEMADLINDLLNVSRLEKKTQDGNISEFNFDDIIGELQEMFRNRIMERHINFNYTPSKPSFNIQSDKDKLREALKNLIDNAIKYSKEEGIINIKTVVLNSNLFRIDIEDNGIGIPEDQQDRIFEKFFRAANVLTENFDGTGLGLYYVKQVVEKLNGKIYFQSKSGAGTTFSIELPIKLS